MIALRRLWPNRLRVSPALPCISTIPSWIRPRGATFSLAHAAPINLEWGRDNRTTGIRVPISEPIARRVENRLAGMDCNPYLAIAASLACGYLGLKGQMKPTKEFRGDAYDGDEDIPRDLFSALTLLSENKEMAECLHPDFVRVFSIVKMAEYDEFLQVISPWEREHLLLNV